MEGIPYAPLPDLDGSKCVKPPNIVTNPDIIDLLDIQSKNEILKTPHSNLEKRLNKTYSKEDIHQLYSDLVGKAMNDNMPFDDEESRRILRQMDNGEISPESARQELLADITMVALDLL